MINLLIKPAIKINAAFKFAHKLLLLAVIMLGSTVTLWSLLNDQYQQQIEILNGNGAFEQAQEVDSERMDVLFFTVLSCAMFIYVLIGYYLGIKREISDLQKNSRAITDGDLTLHLKSETNDELGDLYKGFEAISTGFERAISEIKESAAEVQSAATELSSAAKREVKNSQQQVKSVAAITLAIEEAARNSREIAEQVKEVKAAADYTDSLAGDGGEVVIKSIDSIQKTFESVKNSERLLMTLGDRSNEISKIIEVIQEIAAQTNLLALNAAIEAARAGEHGRGFAVVSDEVRHLSLRTHDATAQITNMVSTIQEEISNNISSMEEVHNNVVRGVEWGNKAGDHLEQIRTNAMNTSNVMHEITMAILEQSEKTQEIAKHIEDINRAAIENGEAFNETSVTADYLQALSEHMVDVIPSNKVLHS